MKHLATILLSALALTLPAFTSGLHAQTTPTVSTVYSFPSTGTDGALPEANLVQGSDGNFYGTTTNGGTNGDYSEGGFGRSGTVFRITPAGKLTILHNFTGYPTDGGGPAAGLIQGSDGDFYGTTAGGGSTSVGTVFKMTPSGVVTILHSFTDSGTDGAYPQAGLIQGKDGNFYGTTAGGGSSGEGTVFKLTPAGALTTLYNFTGIDTDGAGPYAGLVQGSDGNFYGTTSQGGGSSISGDGTVFQITPAGKLTTLHSFTGSGEGATPDAGLVQGSDGNFYGTTESGGVGSATEGTVYRITSAGVLTTVHSFASGGAEGVFPDAGLIQGSDGNFYGTTNQGGSNNSRGTVFRMTPVGVLTVLHTFTGVGTDGAFPYAGLVQGSDGNFYGTTDGGGSSSQHGTLFQITSAGKLTTLHSFIGTGPNGETPFAGVVEGSDGDFYGTTYEGGSSGTGTAYRVTPAGVHTLLHSFTGVGTNGARPAANLVQGSDGNFYGTTEEGGTDNDGTVFRMTPAGALTTLHSFTGTGTDGVGPAAGLVQDSDGNFYGTTDLGGSSGDGTVFKMTPSGVVTILHNFTGTGTDGAYPEAGLVEGSDGNFYGTTYGGGSSAVGTVFRITAAGGYATLHSFTGIGTDGTNPEAGLVQGSDGNFYGTTTAGGGSSNGGTVFKITPAGVYTTLHGFTDTGTDGVYPLASLIEGSDGNFYGTTGGGGSNYRGTLFQITPAGVLTTLHSFTGSGTDGHSPYAGLIQASDGNFYGTTSLGGSDNFGTVFRLNVTPAITSAATATATVGKAFSYQITATNGPASYGVQGLPGGLTVNAGTGLITGTPRTAGKYTLSLNAYNSFGKGTATLTLSVAGAVPVITSATTASGTTGKAFSYQITASGSPTSYGVQGLPGGLAVNASTGLISGAPKVAGKYTLTLNAYNVAGKGSATLTLTVALGPPVVTSATTASGTVGKAFSYQITASGSPTSFGVQGLPAGLSVNATTGLISGTPKAAGTYTLTLNCYNSAGKGSATLTLTIQSS